jgi:hypothetical protein
MIPFKASFLQITNLSGLCSRTLCALELIREFVNKFYWSKTLKFRNIFSIPLAAGLFNREVYIEGIKHRLDNSLSEGSSACVIQ